MKPDQSASFRFHRGCVLLFVTLKLSVVLIILWSLKYVSVEVCHWDDLEISEVAKVISGVVSSCMWNLARSVASPVFRHTSP